MFYTSKDIDKEVITPTARIRLLKNSIIHYTYTSEVEIELPEVEINHKTFVDFTSLKHPLLIDATGGLVNISAEGVQFIKSKEPCTPVLGRAFVTTSLANKLLISINYKINPSIYPFKVFTNYNEAQAWLLSLINQK
ncbi:MAG: hypothetical protein SFY56_15580 [Bacteroidota bacterium]|nr:hypothetical protein [Bacteroidota bacterium]